MLIQKLSVLTVLTKLTCDSVLNVHLFCSTLHYYLIFGVKQLSQHTHIREMQKKSQLTKN